MRATLARVAAALLTVLVAAMAAFFADRRNPRETAPSPTEATVVIPGPPTDQAAIARGRAVFEEQACARCHAVEGRGNPRSPLDGVGARHAPERLRDRVTGSGDFREGLSRSALRAKEEFRRLPGADLDDLVSYLSSLR